MDAVTVKCEEMCWRCRWHCRLVDLDYCMRRGSVVEGGVGCVEFK